MISSTIFFVEQIPFNYDVYKNAIRTVFAKFLLSVRVLHKVDVAEVHLVISKVEIIKTLNIIFVVSIRLFNCFEKKDDMKDIFKKMCCGHLPM